MAHGPSKNRNVKHEHVPINMVSIMNLFIVIIPMLINMWAAYQMAMLYIDVSAGGGAGAAPGANQQALVQVESIKIGLFQDKVELTVEDANGKRIWEQKMPVQTVGDAKVYPLEELNKQLNELRKRYPQKSDAGKFVYDTIGIYPDPMLKYDTLLKTIDLCKFNNFPNIKYLTTQLGFFAEG